ncbi:MAG: RNA methyltransferase, partial [Myxococcota bacterium]
MSLLDLDDIDDPRLEPYRQVRDRDLAGRAHAFMVEGRVVLQTLLRRGLYPLSSVLVSRKRVDALMELLAEVPEAVPIFTLPHDAMVSL